MYIIKNVKSVITKNRIFVLVDDDTKEKLEQCKKALDTTTSDVVRRGIDKVYDELEK